MKIKAILFIILLSLVSFTIKAQNSNAALSMMEQSQKLTIGGYGQIDYNQPLKAGYLSNGTLDVHRLVMLFGYKFTDKTQFITEIELEHVKEVFVEQAFVNHRLLPGLNLRAGLMLVPMGLTNLYHEPTSFMGVERPNLDKYIAPTTWREIGIGVAGQIMTASLKYELYVMNGVLSYNDGGTLRGVDGLRKGRQKGAKSLMSAPNLTGRLSYFGLSGLQLGVSGLFGHSQSNLFDGLDQTNEFALAQADSTIVQVSMLGADLRYTRKALKIKAQYYFAKLDNTAAYNDFVSTDLGSQMNGWYTELAYNVLHHFETDYQLFPFVRYEKYNTHKETDGDLAENAAYDRTEITAGLSWYLSKGSVLKADIQFFKNGLTNNYTPQMNFGVGVWF
ncbi:MAG: hypothetical protein HN936_13330 [Bacteroidetes bacterium]|jgi:hypothetical protein|nr:hypothetical protein [Bacteroidota bacterium]MBT7094223.1 hypothetical protein [Bacteroidota bacterium]MBT7462652.1 hypothetical protein [Bacteroidota bacterium]